MVKLARDYSVAGLTTQQFYTADFDAAQDICEAYAPLPSDRVNDLGPGKWNRNDAKNFIHPMTATEIWTLATFVSQILFGAQTARKVEPRKDTDEDAANAVNELLQWNDDQQATYLQGFLWCKDAMTMNRGIMYDFWKEIEHYESDSIEVDMPYEAKKNSRGNFAQEPKNFKPKKFTRWKTKAVKDGGFNQIDLISPYDFISDPMLPLLRFQESRFAGHRVMIPWQELKARSELDPTDYMYVLPEVVKKIKARPAAGGSKVFNAPSSPNINSRSRSYFDRIRRGNPVGSAGLTDAVNKEDGGVIECFCMHIRATPKQYDIYDDNSQEILELLFSGETELLSLNILTNKHHQFPYAIAEARPNAHYQFSPSWALMIKPIQDFVDYLKKRRAQSLARTSGNVFLCDPTLVDIEKFTDPDKDGLFIPITPEAKGMPLDNIVKQIPVKDLTANFYEEMNMWIEHAEVTSGAHAFVQGKQEEGDKTATEFVGTQQMATGRISTLARLMSQAALVPQTKRFVSNFQQFMPESQVVRIAGDADDYDPDNPPQKYITIQKADIQAEFDVVPHDGALPGQDQRKVAALSRAVEAASNSVCAPFFDPKVPGNIDLKKVLYDLFRLSGIPLQNFVISKETAFKNLQQMQQAQGGGITPGQPPPQAPGGPPPPTQDVPGGGTIPSATEVPQAPSAAPPLPSPIQV